LVSISGCCRNEKGSPTQNPIDPVCCVQLQLRGIKLTIEDVFSPSTATRKPTLGALKNALKDNAIFVTDFEDRLDRFVENRNSFIHYYFTGNQPHPAEGYDAVSASQMESIEFVGSLLSETDALQNLFSGLLYSIAEDAAVREGKTFDLANNILSEWAKYKQDSLDVRTFSLCLDSWPQFLQFQGDCDEFEKVLDVKAS